MTIASCQSWQYIVLIEIHVVPKFFLFCWMLNCPIFLYLPVGCLLQRTFLLVIEIIKQKVKVCYYMTHDTCHATLKGVNTYMSQLRTEKIMSKCLSICILLWLYTVQCTDSNNNVYLKKPTTSNWSIKPHLILITTISSKIQGWHSYLILSFEYNFKSVFLLQQDT